MLVGRRDMDDGCAAGLEGRTTRRERGARRG